MNKRRKIFLLVSLLLAISYVNACSYPSQIKCISEQEVNTITQEWIDNKCTRDELGQCIDAWTNYWNQQGCNPLWKCGDWSSCINNKKTRNCDDGCGNTKTESENCCIPDVNCFLGVCSENRIPLICEDSCGNRKIDRYEKCSNPGDVEEKKIQEYPYDYPIIMVHGWTGSKDGFKEMKEKLIEDNYAISFDDYYSDVPVWMELQNKSIIVRCSTYEWEFIKYNETHSAFCTVKYNIPTHAKKLQEQIEDLKKKANMDQVNIVAHSMGGLIARYYVQNLDKENSVNKIITLGTPHSGAKEWTDMSFFGIDKQWWSENAQSCPIEEYKKQTDFAAEQLSSKSDFIINLNSNTNKEKNVKYYTIFTSLDEVVSIDSANLDFAEINYPDTKCSSHTNLKYPSKCPEAYEYVLDALEFKKSNSIGNSDNQITGNINPTANVITENPKICTKRFLGFLWCVKWEK
jgi:pimeloyl-ACP methyl ester carboxylesterase